MRMLGLIRVAVIALCCTFLSLSSFAQSSSASSSANIQSFALVNEKSGWLLASNHLFWTDSLGSQWADITPSSTASFSVASFHADGTGYLIGHSATDLVFAHTSNKGQQWSTSTITSPFTESLQPSGRDSISFADATHGFLVLGVQSGSAFRMGLLLATTDGGATWTQLPRPAVAGDITFLDAKRGFTGPGPSGDDLYATLDGGNSWKPITLPTPSSLSAVNATSTLPSFTDSFHGSIVRTFATPGASTTIRYSTVDGGNTWTSIPDSSATAAVALDGTIAHIASGTAVSRTAFANASTGLALVSSGNCQNDICTQTTELRATTDGGKSFSPVASAAGISLKSSHSTTLPQSLPSTIAANSGAGTFSPDSASVYNTAGVMGFDACSPPTTAQMTDWITNSPYRVVGVYIGGTNFACKSTLANVTSTYVSTLLTQGWQIIPIWVGPQGVGACSGCSTIPSGGGTASGTTEADSATAAMQALGLYQGSTIIYDMEAYTRTTASYVTDTSNFIQGWTAELHSNGYLSTVYSSHPEFTDWYTLSPNADSIWFAYYYVSGQTCVSSTETAANCDNLFPSNLATTPWTGNHRLRQNSSAFNSTYGTTTISVDEDWVGAPMITATPNKLTITTPTHGTVTSNTITNNNSDVSTLSSINCGSTCTANFASTDTVALTATAATGYVFGSWTGCTSTSGATCTVAMTSATTVAATFVAASSLTVTKSGNGTGTVTSGDSLINCGTTCTSTYTSGASVVLTATAATGSTFASWTGCTTSTGTTCNVTISGASTVTATFTAPVTLTVAASPTAGGTITSADAKLNCGSTCSASYAYNATAVLTAAPATGYVFAGWSGGGCTGTGTCTTSALTAATTVTATFTGPVTLTVAASPTGGGTITSADSKINCGATCSASYTYNTTATLTAVPATGYVFTGWTGCTSTTTTCTTSSLTAATTVTANFTGPVTLTVATSPTGGGTITSADSKINCGSTCSASYTYNTGTTLTATAASGYAFTGWSGGGCTGTGTCAVTSLTAATTVTANFGAASYSATTSTPSLTINKGASGNATLNFTLSNGWTGTFSGFNCTVTGITCSGSNVTAASGSTTATGTVAIAVATTFAQNTAPVLPNSHRETIIFAMLGIFIPFTLRKRRKLRALAISAIVLATFAATQLVTGCGGSSSPSTPTNPTTKTVSVPITFNATQTGGSAVAATPVTVSVTVNLQ